MIYLDSNATTIMPEIVIKNMCAWMNKGNPSSSYKSAKKSAAMITRFRQLIAIICGCYPTYPISMSKLDSLIATLKDTTMPPLDKSSYHIIITSGATESNTAIIKMVTDAYWTKFRLPPHIVVSSTEHKSIIDTCTELTKQSRIQCSYILPDSLGFIQPNIIKQAIKDNTALICVMYANNETGCINNIKEIADIAHKSSIPLHCDIVQSFGKYLPNVLTTGIDSFSISIHKIYGPTGVGVLGIRKTFYSGYSLEPFIVGTQQEGLRGGTENTFAIGGALTAVMYNFNKRLQKNNHLIKCKYLMINLLKKSNIPVIPFHDYVAANANGTALPPAYILLITGISPDNFLINTMLLSLVIPKGDVCNADIKNTLESKNIIVSVGSACNTSSKYASHVLKAMKISPEVLRGVLRISYGDTTTDEDIREFVIQYLGAIKKYVK